MTHRHHAVVSVLSGRFDADDPDVSLDWHGERSASSLLLGTELARRSKAVLDGDPRFGLVHVKGQGEGENAVEYRFAEWKLRRSFYLPVTDGVGVGRFSQKAYALVAIFDHYTGKPLVVIQNHDPAHNLPSSKFYRPGNMARWLDVKRREGRAMRRLEVAHPGAIYLVTGDSNAPQHAPWFIRAMTRFFPGFRNGGGSEFGSLWVKGAKPAWHRTVTSHGSDHDIRRIGLTW